MTVPTKLSPEQQNKTFDAAIGWVQASVLRLIATRGLPLLLGWGVFNGVLAKLQDVIGLNLPKEAVAGYLVTMLAGGVAVLFAWVLNHGRGAARVLTELLGIYQQGRALAMPTAVTGAEPSTTPPLADDETPAIGSTAGTPPVVPPSAA